MSLVKSIWNFRLNVSSEYQGWILIFATLTAFWVYCLPCYCAGLQFAWARRWAVSIQQRLPIFLFFATFVNAGMIVLVVTWLPDWGYGDYIKCMTKGALYVVQNLMKSIVSIAMLAVFVFVIVFKDKFLKLAGIDQATMFRFRLRDMFGKNTRAISLEIYKVEELPAAQAFAPNNVFVEVNLGYNEPMKTRVHNNAGSSCILKEKIQLNFDQDEDEEQLRIFVKNQKLMGSGELGRIEMSAIEITDIEKACRGNQQCHVAKLIPRGVIHFRIEPVEEEEEALVGDCL